MRRLVKCIAIFVLLSAPAFGQTEPNLEQGLKPYGSYQGGNVDSVSLTNGNLTLHIPLLSYPQRGKVSLDFFMRYNNKGWSVRHSVINGVDYYAWKWEGGGGVSVVRDGNLIPKSTLFLVPNQVDPLACEWQQQNTQQCYVKVHERSVVDSSGAMHVLGMLSGTSQLGGYRALDASGIHAYVASDQNGNVTWTVRDSDGRRYENNETIDTNGNRILADNSGWLDTLDRRIPGAFTTDNSFGENTINTLMPGVATADLSGCGTNAVIARNWDVPAFQNSTVRIKLCYSQYTLLTSFGVSYVQEGGATDKLLERVILPNGSFWRFDYNSFGDLTLVQFPTGGTISYEWETRDSAGCNERQVSGKSRWVSRRIVNSQDGQGDRTWVYNWGAESITADHTVTNPDGNATVHSVDGVAGTCSVYEVQTKTYNGGVASGELLSTTTNEFNAASPLLPLGECPQSAAYSYQNPYDVYTGAVTAVNVVATASTTSLSNGKQFRTASTYSLGGPFAFYQPEWAQSTTCQLLYGQVSRMRETDSYVNPVVDRITDTLYQAFDPSVSGYANYFDANLLALPSRVTSRDGGEAQVASTLYGYDEAALQPSMVSTGVDSAAVVRGNVTSVSRWRNLPTERQVASRTSYYDTGMPYRLFDADDPYSLRPTTISYSNTFAGAYPTQTVLPTTHSPNTASHSVTGAYDFNTGLLTQFTNDSGASTSLLYDNMRRLTTVTLPESGQVDFTYPDYVTVRRQQKIDGTRSTDLQVRFDGFGREIRRISFNDESLPYDQTDVCFNGRGLISFQRYPYQGSGFGEPYACASSASTPGDTLSYDGLRRVTSVTHSDGTRADTQYAGAATLVTDEGKNAAATERISRLSQVDGFGRLIAVCEVSSETLEGPPNNSPAACGLDIDRTGFKTTYEYDLLGNLKKVQQLGLQDRNFVYDSLSRLLSAFNPESGLTEYAYSDNGDLLSRTRPSPNQLNPATRIITNYSYDELHRPRFTTYSGDSTGTPAVGTNYDESTAFGVNGLLNTNGRRSSQFTGPNETSRQTGSVFSFDQAGRTRKDYQCTPQNCGSGWYQLDYAYDAIGDILTATNGAGTTFTAQYNRALRLTGLTSSLVDAEHPATLISAVHYTEFGTLKSATLGNGAQEVLGYRPRGWLESISTNSYQRTGQAPGSGYVQVTGSEQSTQVGGQSAAPGSGTVNLAGSIQTVQVGGQSAASGTGSVTISGAEQSTQVWHDEGMMCTEYDSDGNCIHWEPQGWWETVYDHGVVYITVNGQTKSVGYGSGSTPSSIAGDLTYVINVDGGMPVTASLAGATINLIAKSTGANTNYALSATSATSDPGNFGAPSFVGSPSGATLTGGRDYIAPTTIYDYGIVSVTVNGRTKTASYGSGSTPSSIAGDLTSQINVDGAMSVTASSSSSTVTLTARTSGSSTNYTLSATSQTSNPSHFGGPSFTPSRSGPTLTGGRDYIAPTTIFDSGTVLITVSGNTKTYSYGQADTATSVASGLAGLINADPAFPVSAGLAGTQINLTAKTVGTATNYTLSATSATNQGTYFGQASFAGTRSGAALTGGSDGTTNFTPLYTLAMTYAPNGDPLTANDLVNGNWAYTYDYFNRLKTAAKSGLGLSYTYDRYGNRWKQTVTPPGTDSPSFSFTGGNNRIDQLCHDAAGNVLDDRTFTPGPCPADLNSVRFRFDAENRLVSVDGGATGSYVYDAEGRRARRVEQGTVRNYVYDLAGRAITEIGGNGSWVRGEIYAGGRHLGTYVDGKTYFAHSDWLGTERLRSRLIGTEKERFTSWPFGDHLESSGGNSSTLHFTGKERDAESELDYFGARYFSSNFGRWMSPDWSASPEPVPYAELLSIT